MSTYENSLALFGVKPQQSLVSNNTPLIQPNLNKSFQSMSSGFNGFQTPVNATAGEAAAFEAGLSGAVPGQESTGLFGGLNDFVTNNQNAIGFLGGLGQLGLGLAQYNTMKDYYGKQMGLIDQQIKSNEQSLARRAGIEKKFGATTDYNK